MNLLTHAVALLRCDPFGYHVESIMVLAIYDQTLPIEKSIFWSDLGVARKIYHNLAIIPMFSDAPDDSEIKKRVTRFFPRASGMAKSPSWNQPTRKLAQKDSIIGRNDLRSITEITED